MREIVAKSGLEAAQKFMGHSDKRITNMYLDQNAGVLNDRRFFPNSKGNAEEEKKDDVIVSEEDEEEVIIKKRKRTKKEVTQT